MHLCKVTPNCQGRKPHCCVLNLAHGRLRARPPSQRRLGPLTQGLLGPGLAPRPLPRPPGGGQGRAGAAASCATHGPDAMRGALHAGTCSSRRARRPRRSAGRRPRGSASRPGGGSGVSSPSRRLPPLVWLPAGKGRPAAERHGKAPAAPPPASLRPAARGQGARLQACSPAPPMVRAAGGLLAPPRPPPARQRHGRSCSVRLPPAPALPALRSALPIGCGGAALPIRKRLSWRKGINTRWLLV